MTDFWAVAQTRTLVERRVADDLMNRSYECYCPVIQKKRFKGGKRILTSHALFPGYVFVKIVRDCWYDILSLTGVIKFLGSDHPARISDTVISELRSHERNGVIQLPLPFKIGQKVRIKSSGLIGYYDGPGYQHNEKVLVDMLGRMVSVHVKISDLVSEG